LLHLLITVCLPVCPVLSTSTGALNNTLVLFTSDNGGAANNGVARVNFPFRGWKCTHFEGGIRVPLSLQWPAAVRAGQRVGSPAGHVDLFDALLAAADGKELPGCGGAGLLAQLEPAGANMSRAVLRSRRQTDRALTPPPPKPRFWRSGHYRALLRPPFKLQVSAQPDRAWLHDLALDPRERTNLVDAVGLPSLAALQALAQGAEARAGSATEWGCLLGNRSAAGSSYRLWQRQGGALDPAAASAVTALAGAMLDELWRESDRNTPPATTSATDIAPDIDTSCADGCVPAAPQCCRSPAPLWASPLEAAIAIDRLSAADCAPGEEHVYWHL
jgi:hypothetical protein